VRLDLLTEDKLIIELKRFVLQLLRALRVLRGETILPTLRLPLGEQPSQGSERWSSLEPGWRLDHLLRGR